ncbi:dihydrofolate reductase family protein [Clostridiaceae bacterium M8S5]|nr:dihydrofolate reductase family protein [Clostridiaceae bacterium M8S5]
MKRKIILNLAMSLDGYIATDEGKYDWIEGDGDTTLNTEEEFDFKGFLETVDTMIMGRKSYDDCSIEPFKDKLIFIASSKMNKDFDNVRFIKGDIVKIIQEEQKKDGKNIYLFGGGELIDQFIKEDIIDEYVVAIIPTILGKGRKLFLENNPYIKLKLYHYNIGEGVVALHYRKRC